jgi:hypothetical protein
MENKQPFASGRVVDGEIVITLADGTEVKHGVSSHKPKKVSVTVEVEYDTFEEVKEAPEVAAYIRKETTITMATIPRSEIRAYMDSVRAMPNTPWYKRIFGRK